MMEYIRANLFLPGQVENWNILIDLDNLGLASVPYKVLYLHTSHILFIEFEKFHGDPVEPVQMYFLTHLHNERFVLLQRGMVNCQGFPRGAYQEKDTTY